MAYRNTPARSELYEWIKRTRTEKEIQEISMWGLWLSWYTIYVHDEPEQLIEKAAELFLSRKVPRGNVRTLARLLQVENRILWKKNVIKKMNGGSKLLLKLDLETEFAEETKLKVSAYDNALSIYLEYLLQLLTSSIDSILTLRPEDKFLVRQHCQNCRELENISQRIYSVDLIPTLTEVEYLNGIETFLRPLPAILESPYAVVSRLGLFLTLLRVQSPSKFDVLRKYIHFQWPSADLQTVHIAEQLRRFGPSLEITCQYRKIISLSRYIFYNQPDNADEWINCITEALGIAAAMDSDYDTSSDTLLIRESLYCLSFLVDDALSGECLTLYSECENLEMEMNAYKLIIPTVLCRLRERTKTSKFPNEWTRIQNAACSLPVVNEAFPRFEHIVKAWWVKDVVDRKSPESVTSVNLPRDTKNRETAAPIRPVNTDAEEDDTSDSKTIPNTTSELERLKAMPIPKTAPIVPIHDTNTPVGTISNADLATAPRKTLKCLKDSQRDLYYTNIMKKKAYHARIYNYDPVFDQWEYTNVMAKVDEVFVADKEGAARQLIAVDTSLGSPHSSVLKIQQKKNNHEWSTYVSQIRIHQIARYYQSLFIRETEKLKYFDVHGPIVTSIVDAALIMFYDDARSSVPVDFGNLEYSYTARTELTQFIKFTNNAGHVSPHIREKLPEVVDVVTAFSHFSYEKSNRQVLVTDHQGWLGIGSEGLFILMTDPAIHSVFNTLDFGPLFGNKGQFGIDQFFNSQHPCCNELCKELGLKRP